MVRRPAVVAEGRRYCRCARKLLRLTVGDSRRYRRFVRELASTPLLAGLVCALNERASGQLPQRRSDILDAVLGMFGKRDDVRGIGNSELDRAKSEHVLGDLALWMLRNGTTAAASAAARQVLHRSGIMLANRPGADADLYGAALRSGLLRESAAGEVTFLHRIFRNIWRPRHLSKTTTSERS